MLSSHLPVVGGKCVQREGFCVSSGASVTDGAEEREGVPGLKISSLHVPNRTQATFKWYMPSNCGCH